MVRNYLRKSDLGTKAVMSLRKSVDILRNWACKRSVYYVTEPADWVIKEVGISLKGNLDDMSFGITTTPIGIRDSFIHYGSKYTFFNKKKLNLPHRSNKIAVTCYHVSPDDTRCLRMIPEAADYVDLWHTASTTTKKKLMDLGIPQEKIVIVPLGVDTDIFKKCNSEDKAGLRKRLGLPKDKIIIGSFQKDGVGWGEGLEPKLIKGPDIFCDVVERLSGSYGIFVLLTGPSRGYVKKRLEKAKIPYLHSHVKGHRDMPDYYKAIDLYLITAREEGGPLALLESLASAVPLVTTNVGMAPDVIQDGNNGFIVDVKNVGEIAGKASEIIENNDLRKKFIDNGLETVKKYDWKNIAFQYRKAILGFYEHKKGT